MKGLTQLQDEIDILRIFECFEQFDNVRMVESFHDSNLIVENSHERKHYDATDLLTESSDVL